MDWRGKLQDWHEQVGSWAELATRFFSRRSIAVRAFREDSLRFVLSRHFKCSVSKDLDLYFSHLSLNAQFSSIRTTKNEKNRVAGAALFGFSRSRFFGPAPAPTPTPTLTLTHRTVNTTTTMTVTMIMTMTMTVTMTVTMTMKMTMTMTMTIAMTMPMTMTMTVSL